MILLRLAMVENKQDIRKMPAFQDTTIVIHPARAVCPGLSLLRQSCRSTLLHLRFLATPRGNGAGPTLLARAEDVIDSARIELLQMARR
jgi:hypothetical protein